MEKRISDLQVGDRVLINLMGTDYIDTIKKITKTQIVVGSLKFNRETGSLIGKGVWTRGCITIPTEDDEERIKWGAKVKNLKTMMKVIDGQTHKFTDNEIDSLFPIVNDIYNRLK